MQSYTGKYKTELFAVDDAGKTQDSGLGSRGSYRTIDEAKSFAEFGNSRYKSKGNWQ